MWANRLPKLVFIEMIKINGIICVKAPGMDDLVINDKDLEYEKSKEISSKMQDVLIKLILCGDVYDEWFSTYLKGRKMRLTQYIGIQMILNISTDRYVQINRLFSLTLFNKKFIQENRLESGLPTITLIHRLIRGDQFVQSIKTNMDLQKMISLKLHLLLHTVCLLGSR